MFNRVQSTQDEKARFIKGNELKLTHVELFSFLFFLREHKMILYAIVDVLLLFSLMLHNIRIRDLIFFLFKNAKLIWKRGIRGGIAP